MEYCDLCSQAYPDEVDVCTRQREKVLRMGYLGCNDTLYISMPPYGHITHSPTETTLCEAWQARMGRTPEDQLIWDKESGKIVNGVYGCFILESGDEAKLMELVSFLKEINGRGSELRHLDFELVEDSEYRDSDRLELSKFEKQRIENRIIELNAKVAGELTEIKETVMAAKRH